MPLTTARSESLPVFPLKKKQSPQKKKPNKGTLQSKPARGTLRGFVGILWIKPLFPT